MTDEQRMREILAATPHAESCPLSEPPSLRHADDECDCDHFLRAMLAARSEGKAEGVEVAVFRPLATAERKFVNSVGNEIEIYVATGIDEARLCRTSMYGPDSGFDNYSTWDEMVQIHSALSEILGFPAIRTLDNPNGEK